MAPVVRLDRHGSREIVFLKWGLVPSWSQDATTAYKLINCWCESAADKPAFKNAFAHRRCLIVADGFYEWQKIGSGKQPYFITLKDSAPFAFAGLWKFWKPRDG